MENGNPQAEDGHIDIANEIAEVLARYRLSGQEYQVLWVIWRKTYGWHKKEDKISLGQIAELTGINRPGVARVISKLVSKGVIKKDNSYINIYTFNKHYKEWESVTKNDNSPKCYPKREQGVTKNDNKTAIKKDNTKGGRGLKETKKGKKLLQKKKAPAPTQKISFSFEGKKWEKITAEDEKGWAETYPACNIEIELRRMREWLLANPEKKKKNYRRFIVNWLARSQDNGGTKNLKREEEVKWV